VVTDFPKFPCIVHFLPSPFLYGFSKSFKAVRCASYFGVASLTDTFKTLSSFGEPSSICCCVYGAGGQGSGPPPHLLFTFTKTGHRGFPGFLSLTLDTFPHDGVDLRLTEFPSNGGPPAAHPFKDRLERLDRFFPVEESPHASTPSPYVFK